MAAFLKKKDRVHERKKRTAWRPSHLQIQLIIGVIIAVCVAICITAIWYGSRIESLQIERVEVIGGETIPHASIEAAVNAQLIGAYLKLVPKRFMLLYPKTEIINSIASLDRVKHVHVELTDNQTLAVVFDEHVPYALWCQDHASVSCLFIDKTGLAFAPAPELQGSAFVRYIDEGTKPAVDQSGFDAAFMKETDAFITLLEDQLLLYVTHVFKRGMYDVEYTISGGGIIKISQAIPMAESFENLKTILFSEEFKHIEPGAFQYIDLRFGDKVFVNEEIAVPETDTATSTEDDSGL